MPICSSSERTKSPTHTDTRSLSRLTVRWISSVADVGRRQVPASLCSESQLLGSDAPRGLSTPTRKQEDHTDHDDAR